MNNIEINISDIVSRAWELTKKHGIVIAVLIFAVSVISNLGASMSFPWKEYMHVIQSNDPELIREFGESMPGYNFTQLLSSLIMTIASVGFLNMALMLVKNSDAKISFNAFKLPLNTYALYIATSIVYSIITVLGSMLCLIPGIFLAVRLMFAPIRMIEHPEDGFIESFKYSWRATQGNFWNLFLLGLLSFVFCILGFMACCIGIYFAYALIMFIFVIAYLDTKNIISPNTEPASENSADSGYVKTY